MSTTEPVTITGREALQNTLDESGVNVQHTTLAGLRNRAGDLYNKLRRGEPNIVVINATDVEALDVQALRWLFRGGVPPLVLCPSTPFECAEIAAIAVRAATLIPGPVFLLLEDAVAESEEVVGAVETPTFEMDTAAPPDISDLSDDEGELVALNARLSSPPRGLQLGTLDKCPEEMGKPEWLVVSYGSTFASASEATARARAEGQRVNHLNLRVVWPFPESEVMRATLGIKHTVMAERNLGQYAREIRSVLPDMAVVTAGRVSGPVPADLILRKLQSTPRCC